MGSVCIGSHLRLAAWPRGPLCSPARWQERAELSTVLARLVTAGCEVR